MVYNIVILLLLLYISKNSNIQITPPTSSPLIDSTVIAALIAGGVAFIAAVIAASVAIYQTKANGKLQRELLKLQQQLMDTGKAKEEEKQRKAKEEHVKKAQSQAQQQTRELDERLNNYRKKYLAKFPISKVHILKMSLSLEVNNIYIHVRLKKNVDPHNEPDSELIAAEETHNPNILLTAEKKYLEQKISQALDPEKTLSEELYCVIVGDPGAGKTTLLKYLTLQAAQGKLAGLPDLPIHISLNEFVTTTHQTSSQHDLIDFAASIWEKRYQFPKESARTSIQKALHEGKALLLLDALDETVTGATVEEAETTYTQIVQIIQDTHTAYPQTPIVVTARKAGYHARPRLPGFTELEVLDFTQGNIEQFIQNWFDYYHDTSQYGSSEDLIVQLRNNLRIQTLAANPLLLTLIVLVYQAQLNLPDRRAELYKQCVDLLLKEWDALRGIRRKREFKPEYKLLLLEELAWHFHQQGRRYFPDNEVLSQIAQFLPVVGLSSKQSIAILEEIASENGLLKEQAQGWHGFLHLTLQEYFVAKYINHNDFSLLSKHRYDPWWEEVILLYAGQISDASSFLEKLLEQEHQRNLGESLFHRDLLLVGKCLSTRPAIRNTTLRQTVTELLFNQLHTTPFIFLQGNISSALATIGGNIINNNLLFLISQENLDIEIRQKIADAFGNSGERSIAPQLVTLLAQENLDTIVRGSIADALGALGDRSIIPQLIPLLSQKSLATNVRCKIAIALSTLGERSIAPQLIPLLSQENLNIDIRSSIATALGALGERSIAPQLIPLLSQETLNTLVRGSIADALGALGDHSIIQQLLSLLSQEDLDTYVRSSIATTLGTLGDRSIAPQLLSLLAKKNLAIDVRSRIADALGTIGDRSIIPQLLSLLAQETLNIDVQGSIATTLGTLGDRFIAPQLITFLSQETLAIDVERKIAITLGTLGDRSIVPQLLSLLAQETLDTYVRSNIAITLGILISDNGSLQHLTQLLWSQSTKYVINAIYTSLWRASSRLRINIYIKDGASNKREKQITILPWEE